MLEKLCKRIQRCFATLRRSRNERNVESYWFKGVTGFNLCAATHNNMQQGVQTAVTCSIQKCWELLANNVASVCMGLDSYDCYCFFWLSPCRRHPGSLLELQNIHVESTGHILSYMTLNTTFFQQFLLVFHRGGDINPILDNYRVILGRNGFNLILLLIFSWRQGGHMHVGWKNKLKRLSLTETKLFFMQIILRKTNSSKCLVKQNGRLFTWLQSTSKEPFTCIYDLVYYDNMNFFEPIWVHKPFYEMYHIHNLWAIQPFFSSLLSISRTFGEGRLRFGPRNSTLMT